MKWQMIDQVWWQVVPTLLNQELVGTVSWPFPLSQSRSEGTCYFRGQSLQEEECFWEEYVPDQTSE